MVVAARRCRNSVGMAHAPHHPDHDPRDGGRLTLHGPAALAAVLPLLIEPEGRARIVMAVLGSDRLLRRLAHRLLPTAPNGASAEVQQHWFGLVSRLITDEIADLHLRPGERAAVALQLLTQQRLRALRGSLFPDPADIPAALLDVVLVADGHWRSLLCTDPGCCPDPGRAVLDDRAAVSAMADLFDDDREQPHRSCERIPGPPLAAVAAALCQLPYPATAGLRGEALSDAWPLVDRVPSALAAEQAASLIMAGDRPGIRDALLTRIARSEWSASPRAWQLQWGLWTSVADLAPAGWAAGPRCLQAVSAWSLGQRRDALLALHAAHLDQPGHRMTVLLGQLLTTGADAEQWFDAMRRLSESECLLFDRPAPPRAAPGGPRLRDAG